MATDRRQQIRLSPDEQAAFFRERKKAALATIDKDGFPHVVAMNYFERDGAFYMTSYGKAQKVVNIRRNPKEALMIEAGAEYRELRGSVRGARGRNQRQGEGGGTSECVAGPAGRAGQRAEARGAQDRSGEGGQLGPPQARRTILTRGRAIRQERNCLTRTAVSSEHRTLAIRLDASLSIRSCSTSIVAAARYSSQIP